MSSSVTYELTHLQTLEAESIHVIREVAAEFERPVLLFSGGKDSAVMLHLAATASARRAWKIARARDASDGGRRGAAHPRLRVADMDMPRVATAGPVDDGTSTLIGRLLHDSKTVAEDQFESVELILGAAGPV